MEAWQQLITFNFKNKNNKRVNYELYVAELVMSTFNH